MNKKEKQNHPKGNTAPVTTPASDAASLKDNPDGETVCSAYFSKGCINEDTASSTIRQEGDENEKY